MDKAARIRAVGVYDSPGRRPGSRVCKVRCQGCGEYIFSNGSLEDVEYVKTKRRSELFFHRRCLGRIWERKMI